jgi:uncharacterized spore protein YtfJ
MRILEDITSAVKDTTTVGRVFGQPYDVDGAMIIPVARIGGGGGGGGDHAMETGGSGGGFGVTASPVGVYVVRDGDVRFVPTVDVVALASRAVVLAVAGTFAWRSVARARHRRKAKTARR